jgi:anti-sigma B factor antagonist
MELSKATTNGWQVIKVSGQIDSKTVTDLKNYLDSNIAEGSPMGLDVTEVPFMSSAGLRTLLTLHRKTEQMGISLAIIGLKSEIADTMKVTGFYQYFTIYSDLQSLPAAN